jgi:hypothetical protein
MNYDKLNRMMYPQLFDKEPNNDVIPFNQFKTQTPANIPKQ